MQGRSQKEALVFRTGLLIPFIAVFVDKHALLRMWTPRHNDMMVLVSQGGQIDVCVQE